MGNDETLNNYRTLLNLRENLRNRFSSIITNLLGFVIIANAAIWSFFGQSFVAYSYLFVSETIFAFLIASAISSVTIGIWRMYTRHVDGQAANLYPEILRYELKLGVLPTDGIRGYLSRYNENIKYLFSVTADNESKQIEVVSELLKLKRISSRGHTLIDRISIGVIGSLLVLSVILIQRIHLHPKGHPVEFVCLGLVIVGLVLVNLAHWKYQKEPSKDDTKKILKDLRIKVRKRT